MSNQGKHWCFTLNNHTDAEVDALKALAESCQYLVFGREVGALGTPHLQGYAVFLTKKRLNAIKKLDGLKRAHLEQKIPQSTPLQAATYCKKDGDFEEFGELDDPDARNEKQKTDWAAVLASAKEGDFEAIPPSIYIHCRRTLKEIRREMLTANCPPSMDRPCGIWYVGPPGCGKSRLARETWPDAYLKPINKWWDGYAGEETVILEDWDHTNSMTLHNLKIWADGYQFPAEVKGDTIKIRPKRIVVTSNYRIEELATDKDLCTALKRRFDVTSWAVVGSGLPERTDPTSREVMNGE